MFAPTPGTILTEDGITIAYDHYKNGHDKLIILIHGFYNSKQAVLFRQMAQLMADDYDVLSMDLRGHGKSSGRFGWSADEPNDLRSLLEFVKKDYKKIGVIAYSLGAAIALITASRSDLITSLIAVAAPTQFNKIDFQFWKMGIMENVIYNVFQEGRIGKGVRPGNLWKKKTAPIDIVAQIANPVLFVHGKKDWLIHPSHSEALYARAVCLKKLVLVEEGTHAEYIFRRDPQGTIKIFKEWFQGTLGQ